MKKAVALLAYDRFDYLSLVLPSLLSQTVAGRPLGELYDIWLFQDGLCVDDERSDAEAHAAVARLFAASGLRGRVFVQPENLGVARHFDFVEKKLFREEGYDYVVFCEDDLILAPGFMAAMDLLAGRFANDRRVGMVSAHPGECWTPLDEQRARAGRFAAMDHNWGFGLFREFWERRQPFVEGYLQLIAGLPYRNRPHRMVFEWLEGCGFEPAGSSQDYVKQCATTALGAARVATAFNLGLPIGRRGLHCRPELFEKMGFHRTVVFQGVPVMVGELSQADYAEILSRQASKMKAPPKIPQAGIDEHAAASWVQRVADGEMNPERVLGADWRTRNATPPPPPAPLPVRKWRAEDISRSPHMEAEGLAVLREQLSACRSYLEYGAGGSTVLAAAMGVGSILSVESDSGFLDAVREAARGEPGADAIVAHPVDVGPTADWGNPVDPSCARRWPDYPGSVWQRIASGEVESPDLVLIDGRFRVACFLATAMRARPGTVILFDDYVDREHYHVVEKWLKPASHAGRMGRFVVPEDFGTAALPDLLHYSADFR